MHKKLGRPTLLDDENDDEISNFDKNSNRFLKSNHLKDKPKEEFHKDTHDRQSTNRSITPRSVDTDSDLGTDYNDENENIDNFKTPHNFSKNNDFNPDFKTEIKKSPRSSLSNSKFNNQNSYPIKPNIVERSDKFSKSPRETKNERLPEPNPRTRKRDNNDDIDSRLDKNKKENNFSDMNSNENDDDLFTHKNNSLSKTLKFSESEKVSKIFDTINKKPEDKLKISKLKFALDEEDEMQDNDNLRTSRTNNMKLSDENNKIEDNRYFRKSKNDKMHFLNEDDNTFEDNKYLKTSRNNNNRLLDEDDDANTTKNKYLKKPRNNDNRLLDDDDDVNKIKDNKYMKKTRNNEMRLLDDDDDDDDDTNKNNKYLKKSKNNDKRFLDDGDDIDKIKDNKYMKSKNNEIRFLDNDDNVDNRDDNKYVKKPRKVRNQLFDEDDNTETNKYLKKSKNSKLKLLDDDDEIQENKYLKKSKDSKMKVLNEDDEDEDKRERNKYVKELQSKKFRLLEDEEIQDNIYLRKSKDDKLKSMNDNDETDFKKFKKKSKLFEESEFNKHLTTKKEPEDYNNAKAKSGTRLNNHDNYFDSDENELIGSTRYIHNDSSKRLKDYDLHDGELNNSSKLLNLSQMNDSHHSTKSEIKPKPRKSHLSKTELDDERPFHKDNKNVLNDDIKRRSIRFDDQIDDYSRNTSRESSPRKSILSRQSSNRNSPSPPTSICEEVVQDPATLKLKNLQKKQEENRRENESKMESLQHRIINDSINAVADSQHEKESNATPSSRQSISRPVSAKYKNVPPRVTTRINIKSIKSPSMTDEWLSTPNLYSDQEKAISDRTFTNSQTIREAAYLQWYLTKLSEKNLKNQTNKTTVDKKKNSSEEERISAYESWITAKKQYFLELARKKKEEKKKNEETKVPVKDAKLADMAFEVWRKQKEEKIKEETKENIKHKKEKERLLLKEQEARKNKKSESVTEWEIKKAKEIHDKKMQLLKEERIKKEEEKKKKEKLYEAEKAYLEWEEKADKKEKQYSDFEKNKIDLINNRRAWRPSSHSSVKARRI